MVSKRCKAGVIGYKQDADVSIDKGMLVVKVPIIAKTPTRSKYYNLIATTRGNRETSLTIDGRTVNVGLNAYISRPKKTRKKMEPRSSH